MKQLVFKKELECILADDLRQLCIDVLSNAPDYFWYTAASSSGKYHPSCSLGLGGLVRHTWVAARYCKILTTIEQNKSLLTQRQIDCLLVAVICHDTEKLGRNGSSYTLFNHPILAADRVRLFGSQLNIDPVDIEYIAMAISSHMGEWNTSTKNALILPKPITLGQQIVHLADYLAAQKGILYEFDEEQLNALEYFFPTEDDYTFTFGAHKGETFTRVKASFPGYITWLETQDMSTEPLATFLRKEI